MFSKRHQHRRATNAIRELRDYDRESHSRFRFERLRRQRARLLSSAPAPRTAVPFGSGADEADPRRHRALAAIFRTASDSLRRDRRLATDRMTDPVVALLIDLSFLIVLAAVRFFKTLEADLLEA